MISPVKNGILNNFRELALWKAAGLPDLGESNSAKKCQKNG
jgi:hypothetical protein